MIIPDHILARQVLAQHGQVSLQLLDRRPQLSGEPAQNTSGPGKTQVY